MVVLFSTAAAVFFGIADFLGGSASRRDSAIAVTANAHVIGLLLFGLGALLMPAQADTTDLVAGAAAGLTGGIGVTALYAALARGRMSIVAPVTAALSGSLPAVYDVGRGSAVSTVSAAGLVLAVIATIVVSAAPDEDGGRPMSGAALALSLLAGAAFAGSFVALSFVSDESGLWPLVSARVVSVTLFGVLALVRVRRLLVREAARRPTVGAGLLDSAATWAVISAVRAGPLAVAAVLGSLYPVVTVLLARSVLGERLRGMQRVGIALALAAVVLSALS